MKKWTILFAVLVTALSMWAQSDFNALKQELKTASEDRKIDILIKLADMNLVSSPQYAIDYAKLALDLTRKTNDHKDEGFVLGRLGYYFYRSNDLTTALDYGTQSLIIYSDYPNYKGYSSVLDNVGRIYEDKGQYQRAYDMYYKSLQIKQRYGERQGLAEVYYSLAVICKYLGKGDLAFQYYQRGIDAEESVQEAVKQDYLDKSKAYAAKGEQEKALYYYQLYSSSNDTLHVLFTKANRKRMREMKLQFEALRDKKERENVRLKHEKSLTEQELLSATESSKQIGNELRKEKRMSSEMEKIILLLNKDKLIQNLELNGQKVHNQFMSFIALLFLVITFLFYMMYYLKNRSNKALQKAYSEIRIKNEELSNAYQILDLIARKDPLTNLSNRRDMLEKIKYTQVTYERNNKPFTLVMIDIDHFKRINDTYGHDAGDFVLIFISNVIQSSIRKQDFVARWGGEEFLLLLPETDAKGGRIVGEKIRANLANRSCTFNQQEIKITLTAGVSCYADFNDVDVCLKKADEALYIGKENGRNQVVLSSVEES